MPASPVGQPRAAAPPFLGRQLGEEGLRLHRRIKGAMDPLGILNPGKVL
ncbi:FAD-linked oxidase C-terminal domain-containing protein [Myxococcus virescens]